MGNVTRCTLLAKAMHGVLLEAGHDMCVGDIAARVGCKYSDVMISLGIMTNHSTVYEYFKGNKRFLGLLEPRWID